jgi:predicted permease
MRGLLVAFGTIWTVTAVGWVIGRFGLLGPRAELVLARLVFYVAAPALLFATLSTADLAEVFTGALAAFAASTAAVAALYVALARLWWRAPVGETAIGTMCASYVNAGNLGIPVAVYVLGDIAYAAPVLIFQLLIAAPTALAFLEISEARTVAGPGSGGRGEWRRILPRLLLFPARNPITVSSAAGVAVALSGWRPPDALLEPFELVGSAAVPVALLALGLSLTGVGAARTKSPPAPRYAALALKVVVQPLLAYLIGRHLLGLDGPALLAAVVTSGLPTAQNIYVYAVRYRKAEGLARDAILLSTVAAAFTLLAFAYWLG